MSVVFSPTTSSLGADYTSITEDANSREASLSNLASYVESLQLLDLPPAPPTTHVEHPLLELLLPNPGDHDDDGSKGLRSLPDQVLHIILSMVDVRDRLCSLPLVCTRFRDMLLRHRHSLWNKLHLPPCDGMAYRCWTDNRTTFRVSATQWFLRHGDGIEHFDMTLGRKAKHAEFVLDMAMAALPSTPSLRTFIFSCQAPAALLECMSFCPSLRVLQLELLTGLDRSSTALTGLARLTSLRVLKLNWNTPIAFPAALLQLHSLSVLTIGAVDHLPRDVHCLDSLTRFEMLSCVQRRTPEHLSTLRSLCQLGLYAAREGQQLALSDSLSSLTQLTCLWVADGRLDNLDALAKLTSLRSVWLHTCALAEIPTPLSHLYALERLIVLNDSIDALPPWLGRLPRLASVSVIDNASAVAMPAAITQATALTALRVSRRHKDPDAAPLVTHVVEDAQGGDGVAVRWYHCEVTGALESVLTCPPGLPAATLGEAAAVWSFVSHVLSRPTKRLQQI